MKWTLRRRAGLVMALTTFWSCGGDSPLGPEAPRTDPNKQASEKPKPSAKPAVLVHVGLEQVDADRGAPLKGKKVGIIMHAASVTSDGRRTVEVLRAAGVEVVKIFGPEHGAQGKAAAGEKVADAVDPLARVPVVSLYGDKTKPSAEDLKGLDALVFDLQDGGVRFYTYVSTMILALEAAADADIEFVVLDRPNPLGGERVEGPESDSRDVVPASLVNTAPGPLVHGLTAGEMAQFVNSARSKPARLTVVPMHGWKRSMTWAETGRAWVAPSPNIRSSEAALVYPGTALLEGTNVSEGRGTDAPFLMIGAPWLKAEAVIPSLPAKGLTLETAAFTPAVSAAAPAPKYVGQPCAGIRIGIKDTAAVAPYKFGVGLLVALKAQPGFEWLKDGAAIDRLVGTKKLRAAIDRGDPFDAIVAADLPAIEAFRKARQKSLLY
ncbi:MAG: DUF1343 domain-containing protein [Acidobacteria bacterium]|nr:MAG: DUF1343 domain-containing protein [Acidobacteriota bacterium]